MTQAMAPVRSSLVQVRIGNRIYDAVKEPRCHTCTHPARMEIETAIVENLAYTTIAERYSEVEYTSPAGDVMVLPPISANSIRTHFRKRHLPLQAAVQRQLAEQRMQQIGYDLEGMGGAFVDQVTFSQAVLQRAHERLVAGEIVIEAKDGLAAAKFLAESERQAGGELNQEAWSEAMQVYFTSARQIMSPAQWAEFTRVLHGNPILKALEARISGQAPPEAITVTPDPYAE
jgi:hypothetical protein